jgi:hypothetical protein
MLTYADVCLIQVGVLPSIRSASMHRELRKRDSSTGSLTLLAAAARLRQHPRGAGLS